MTFQDLYAKHGPGYCRTKDGRKALVGADGERLIGLIIKPDHSSSSCIWFGNGTEDMGEPYSENRNLVDVWTEPRKISGWVNVNPHGWHSVFYDARAQADKCAMRDRLACIYVSDTEGVGPEESK
jgi:hypothetical protein